MHSKLKVYLADDHTLFRKAMMTMMQQFTRVGEVKDAENGKELLTLVKSDTPDVVLVDLQMPIMDGVEASETILKRFPGVKVIVLTMHDSEKYIMHMIELGVHAFLLKNTEPAELERAIYQVVEKDFYHNDLVANVLRKSVLERRALKRPMFRQANLSEREKEVLLLICQELTIREIGQRLSLSENTVRNHRVHIMSKVGVNSMVGLVKFAYDSGLMN